MTDFAKRLRTRVELPDAIFVGGMTRHIMVDAADEIDRLTAAAEGVRALHYGPVPDRRGDPPRACAHCWHAWPCPTIQALDGAEVPA